MRRWLIRFAACVAAAGLLGGCQDMEPSPDNDASVSLADGGPATIDAASVSDALPVADAGPSDAAGEPGDGGIGDGGIGDGGTGDGGTGDGGTVVPDDGGLDAAASVP